MAKQSQVARLLAQATAAQKNGDPERARTLLDRAIERVDKDKAVAQQEHQRELMKEP